MMRSFVALFVISMAPMALALRVVDAFPGLNFDRPVFLAEAPGNKTRVYVVEQSGRIKTLLTDGKTKTAGLFLDLTDRVNTEGNEMGLLGLAFSPDYSKSREFFVSYTAVNPTRLVVAAFKSKSDEQADPASFRLVIEVPKNEDQSNHNGGMIAFGPDRKLYIGTGDGGGAGDRPNNSQNKMQLLGKILRIDPLVESGTYKIPGDNPFKGVKEARAEIWAWGLRNPWRFSFDSKNGDLWAADVGQNKFEEINIIRKGGNYGWRLFEGLSAFNNPEKKTPSEFVAPIHIYSHDDGYSITGGYVYRGRKFRELEGKYIYGDYGSGTVWGLDYDGKVLRSNSRLARVDALSSFAEASSGELYLISLTGSIYRFER